MRTVEKTHPLSDDSAAKYVSIPSHEQRSQALPQKTTSCSDETPREIALLNTSIALYEAILAKYEKR